ncbi:MAG: PaaI family thioesterase [Acidimicrobiia bacterium]
MTAPIAQPEPGWEACEPFPFPEGTFLAENNHVRLAYFRKPGEPTLYAKAWFGSKTMGPPGHVHGGALAATLDEAMGAVSWLNAHKSVAASITISFIAMLPLETDTVVEARIEKIDGRKIHVRSTLKDPSGRVVAEGSGLFVVLRDDQLKALERP